MSQNHFRHSQHPLRMFRVANDLSLQSIADALNVAVATVSRIETGERRCTPEMAQRIETITKGIVHRALLRPDLWSQPGDAPNDEQRDEQ